MTRIWKYRLLQPFIVLLFIYLIGVVGYMGMEHYRFLDALFMTTISITTVGYEEIQPLSDNGKIFTIFLLVTSLATFAWALARITQFVISGEIYKYFKTRRIMRSINHLNRHVIVCGFGRNGQQAARTLKNHKRSFVVIEKDESLFEKSHLIVPDLMYLIGDSTNDEILTKAGVERAAALITALPDDAANVFIVLTVRALNKNIQIISRASNDNSIPKLKMAGADNIIMPDKIGGSHMATLVSKPDVIEFMDFLSSEDGESVNMESVPFETLPKKLQNKSLQEVMEWHKTGVSCLGIKNSDGKFIINPPADTVVAEGSKVIVFGTKVQIEEMKSNLD